MEKVAANKQETVSLLKVQYRMHQSIMQFSSEWFYQGELQAAPEVTNRGILDLDLPIELDLHLRNGVPQRICRRKLRPHQ